MVALLYAPLIRNYQKDVSCQRIVFMNLMHEQSTSKLIKYMARRTALCIIITLIEHDESPFLKTSTGTQVALIILIRFNG